MTGKDLVLFIIKHDLLNEKIDSSNLNKIFLTIEEAAVKLGVSTASLQDMLKLGMFDYVIFDEKIYLHKGVQLTSIKRR